MRSYVTILVCVSMLLAPCARAEVKAQQLELKAGALAVTVKEHDGEPMPKAEVRLTDADGKLLSTVTADKDGKCSLPDLKPGSYKLLVAARGVIPFTVNEEGKVTELLVVLPAPPQYAAGDAKETVELPAYLTYVIIGTLVVAGTAAAVSGGGGSSGGSQHP